jgi:hypothetical protein
MTVGTKSVLFGVHCFAIHPWLIALAWWKLYGFPWDPRLWLCFFVHDIGYLGKPNMDGPEGELHPYLGAKIVALLCDGVAWGRPFGHGKWGMLCLLHSRYLAKKLGLQPSRLAIADKLVIAIEPSWLYLPRAIASGEINDYFEQAVKCDPDAAKDEQTRRAIWDIWEGGHLRDARQWHRGVRAYMRIWVETHKDGAIDTMTSETRGN